MKQKLGMKANRAELFSRFGILLIFALVVLVASLVRHAADTLVRDLATTLGYEVMQTEAPSDDGAEVFAVSDEFGIIPVEGTTGPVISKLSECFDKLWSLDK